MKETIIGLIGTFLGTIITFIVAKLNGWWDDKTSIPAKTLKRVKALETSNDKLWSNSIVLRESIEAGSQVVKDRPWTPPKVRDDEETDGATS